MQLGIGNNVNKLTQISDYQKVRAVCFIIMVKLTWGQPADIFLSGRPKIQLFNKFFLNFFEIFQFFFLLHD